MRTTSTVTQTTASDDELWAPWLVRVRARMQAARFDRELECGVPVVLGTALAVHAGRLVSEHERSQLADTLDLMCDRARNEEEPLLTTRIPLRCSNILAEEPTLTAIVERLRATRPARARGVARLRLLLADGLGPLYESGSGSVAAALRGVLAAL